MNDSSSLPDSGNATNSFVKTIQKSMHRPNVNERRIINESEESDVVQLSPMKHKFAWDAYLAANANHWLPTEISMQRDIELWKDPSALTPDERHAFKRVMGFFTTGDSIVANNLVLAVYKHITSPECRMYLLRQAYEEAIHTHAYQYIVESLELDEGEIFNMYREVDSIMNKDNMLLKFSMGVLNPNFTTQTQAGAQQFLEDLIGFYVVCEGLFFYTSFAVILSFQRQNKLVGSAEQIQYIMRDESMHMNFGIDVINTIKAENPELWTKELEQKIYASIDSAVNLEVAFAKDCFPKGILGINSDLFSDYMQHIADRRLERIGLLPVYKKENPFPWMSEAIDLSKEKNFFETRVTEYQTGGTLEW
jgi:ribonucleoside-diphosphate reductase beta chain